MLRPSNKGRPPPTFLRKVLSEVEEVRRYQREAPQVHFTKRDKLSLFLLVTVSVLAMLAAGYLWFIYKGPVWDLGN